MFLFLVDEVKNNLGRLKLDCCTCVVFSFEIVFHIRPIRTDGFIDHISKLLLTLKKAGDGSRRWKH